MKTEFKESGNFQLCLFLKFRALLGSKSGKGVPQ